MILVFVNFNGKRKLSRPRLTRLHFGNNILIYLTYQSPLEEDRAHFPR